MTRRLSPANEAGLRHFLWLAFRVAEIMFIPKRSRLINRICGRKVVGFHGLDHVELAVRGCNCHADRYFTLPNLHCQPQMSKRGMCLKKRSGRAIPCDRPAPDTCASTNRSLPHLRRVGHIPGTRPVVRHQEQRHAAHTTVHACEAAAIEIVTYKALGNSRWKSRMPSMAERTQ